MPSVATDGKRSLVRSSLSTYAKNTGFLSTARKVHAKEFTPNVSENISMINPARNERVSRNEVFRDMGKRIMKYMKTIGIATLKSAM